MSVTQNLWEPNFEILSKHIVRLVLKLRVSKLKIKSFMTENGKIK